MTAAEIMLEPLTPETFLPSCAFIARGDQGVNYLENVRHAPLIALEEGAVFAVVDRIGPEDNLEEHRIEPPVHVVDRGSL